MTDISIVSVCRLRGIELTKRGSKFVALCPLHPDKSPSFTIYPDTNTFFCFGCKKGGDVYELIKKLDGTDFYKAKLWIEENLGVLENVKLPDLTTSVKKKKLSTPVNLTEILYWHSLMDECNKREYWLNRGFTDSIIDTQLLGYNGEGFTIPIWTEEPQKSECSAYKVRYLDDKHPKYVKYGNINTVIYNHFYCEFAPTILAFAGELDCLRAVQDGLPSFSLVDGKNSYLGDNWASILFPYSKNLIVCFDRGEESEGALLAEQWEKSKEKFSSSVLCWPLFEGKDYCDWRINHTVEEFLSLL